MPWSQYPNKRGGSTLLISLISFFKNFVNQVSAITLILTRIKFSPYLELHADIRLIYWTNKLQKNKCLQVSTEVLRISMRREITKFP